MMLINGRADGLLDPRDRGLHYGDGLFETLLVRDAKPLRWSLHMARLARGCERLSMQAPDFAVLEQEAQQLCRNVDRGVLKVLWTRGPGGRGYAPFGAQQPTRVVALYPAPEYPATYSEQGIKARWCSHRLGHNPALAGIKHLNRLEQVMARAEWQDPEVAEGLMCDLAGNVISGTMTNLFLVKQGALRTPDLSQCGIAGITRQRLLAHAAAEGMPCTVASVSRREVMEADEVFVCNSVHGVWQIRSLGERTWPGGVYSRRLAAAMAAD